MLLNIMKIEKINENKLRITIPLSYFAERNISFENFDYNSEETQAFFLDLMETLDEEYGFSFLNSQLVVEAMPGDSDDVILTLTRSTTSSPGMSAFEKYLLRKNRHLHRRSVIPNPTQDNVIVAEFESFEDVCDFVKSIGLIPIGFNSLYKLNNSYFLVVNKRKTVSNHLSNYLITYLEEFGEVVYNPDFFEGYLNEYGNLAILGNATEVLYAYFAD